MKRYLIFTFIFLWSMSTLSQKKEAEITSVIENTSQIIIDNYIEPFYFDQNSSEYNDYKKQEDLKKICKILIEENVKDILLTGHCTQDEFIKHPSLSKNRAETIRDLMIEFGIHTSIIIVKDYNKEQPIDWTKNDKKNQRIQLILLAL